MSTKLLPNRSSKSVAPNAVAKLRQAIQLLHEVLGDDTPIDEAEYVKLRKIADKLKQECDDVFTIVREHPDFVEAPLSVSELEKDKLFYELCDLAHALLKAVMLKLDREQNIAGAEYYNGCSVFEADVEAKFKRGMPKAQNVYAQLKALNRNRPGNPVKKDGK
jgi:hypothetical protein